MSCARIRGPFLMPLSLDAPFLSIVALVCRCRRSLVNARYQPSAPCHTRLTRCTARLAWFAALLSKPTFVRNVALTLILFDASCNNAAKPTTA